uniref:Uncharacterized protein n=1 Tax=Chromera velia CCMP2878 TaxID=1169474 RepID=A0A0G4HRN2_9ALVE|eukprot:Cvel_30686.t1-p1 / transcript=Cvel_30686.t1 / gene=Cvel_30686 / organism=Chromera_velia_CCMP2878 / gene_product=hypothetical protein / transcript_product=hypothetical protein / location=Cvel_scaffold4426:3047-3499(+) / protein_length=151 / sequence_SO=supercontig / SO=protein_coding / is_pseudo=false
MRECRTGPHLTLQEVMQALDTSWMGLFLPSHSGERDRWSQQQPAQGSSPSSPTSLGRDFGHTGTQGRSWSPSFGGSPQPRHPRAQPVRRVGSRHVARVKTIRGKNEEDDVVVESNTAIRREAAETAGQEGDQIENELDEDEDDSFETGFVY